MAISAAAKSHHDQLFGDRVSTLAQSDPELTEYFGNFAFDEVRADELSTIDGCGEVDIATRRSDGTLRAARIVWIVRHGNAVYVRSVNGTTAALVPRRPDLPRGRAERWTTPDHLNDEKDTTWTRTPAAPR